MSRSALPLLLVLLALPGRGQAPEIRTTAADREGLAITITQDDRALVTERRRVVLPRGRVRLAFGDLLPTLLPHSPQVALEKGGPRILERNVESEFLSRAGLLRTSLGRQVLRKAPDGSFAPATLASLPPPPDPPDFTEGPTRTLPTLRGVVLGIPEGFEAVPFRQVAFQEAAPGLRAEATLVVDLEVPEAGPRTLELAYLASGLTWQASYAITLAGDARTLDLEAWATLRNRTGMALEGARLQLLCGHPNQVEPDLAEEAGEPPPLLDEGEEAPGAFQDLMPTGLASLPRYLPYRVRRAGIMVDCCAAVERPPSFAEESLGDNALFTLDRPTTLRNGQEKQLFLLKGEGIPLKSSLRTELPLSVHFDAEACLEACEAGPEPGTFWHPAMGPDLEGSEEGPVERRQRVRDLADPAVRLRVAFDNLRGHGLGRALPGGTGLLTARQEGAILLLGRPVWPDTPPGQTVELDAGPVRGLRVHRSTVSLRRSPGPVRAGILEQEVRVLNEGPEDRTLTLREPFHPGWTLLEASHPGTPAAFNALDFQVRVPGRGTALLRYRVRFEPPPAPPVPDVPAPQDPHFQE